MVEVGGLLKHIVASKESWVYCSQPEMKGQAKKHGITAPSPRKKSVCRHLREKWHWHYFGTTKVHL